MPPTSQAAGDSRPVQVLVGPPTASPSIDITQYVDIDTLRVEETGIHDSASLDMRIKDDSLAYKVIRGEWKVRVQHLGIPMFLGYIRQPRREVVVRWPFINCSAIDVGSALDRCIIKTTGIKRTKKESDKARIQWLVDTFGQPLVREGLTSWSRVQVLSSSLPDQTFPPRLTLRQAIERVLGAASESSDYYVDYVPRLHTFDDSNTESDLTAPFDVALDSTLSGSEVAPEDFEFEWDSSNRRSGFYVQGANSAGSGYVTDQSLDMAGPWSASLFGASDDYLSAPDADTRAKRDRVAKAALRDTRNPIPRGSFAITGSIGTGARWQAGQLLYVRSAMHGLNGRSADDGPWAGSSGGIALQPFRIVRITTTWFAGGNSQRLEIEFGGRRVAFTG